MIVRLWTCIAWYYLPDFFIHLIRLMNIPLTQKKKKKKKDVIFSGVNHHYKLLLQNQT